MHYIASSLRKLSIFARFPCVIVNLATFSSIGEFCAYNPTYTIVPVVAILAVLCFGSRYYKVTTDPVDLWVASNSRARQEKAFFDENFG